jgi:hypothetical protein
MYESQAVSEKVLRNQPTRNKNCSYGGNTYWLTDLDEMCKLYRCFLPSFGLFGKVVSKENNLRNQPNRKKNCDFGIVPILWYFLFFIFCSTLLLLICQSRGVSETCELKQNRDEMWKLYKCFPPSFGLFGKVVSKENNLRNQPNRKKNCLYWLCLTTIPSVYYSLRETVFSNISSTLLLVDCMIVASGGVLIFRKDFIAIYLIYIVNNSKRM